MRSLKLLLCVAGMHDWKIAHPLFVLIHREGEMCAKECSRCKATAMRPMCCEDVRPYRA